MKTSELIPYEHDSQATFFAWIRLKQEENDLWKNVAAIPNGAHLARGKYSFARLHREGFSKGFPDVVVMLPASGHHGLFIEFKRKGAKPSAEQIDWGRRLSAVGYCYRFCYSFEEAQSLVIEYLGSHLQKVRV